MMQRWFLLVWFFLGSLFLSRDLFAQGDAVVLVHGALFSSAGWAPLQGRLQDGGFNAVTLDVPGRAADGWDPRNVTLATAAAKVCQVLRLQSGPVILVGHSQGGALITQAASHCADRIKALVYIAAVVPLDHEAVFQDLDKQDNLNFDRCATYDDDAKLYRVNRQGPLREMFLADVPEPEASRAMHAMVDEPSEIGNGVMRLSMADFQRIPKYYIETTEDQIISISTQRRIQAKLRFRKIFTLRTSHSPFLSQPAHVAAILREIHNGCRFAHGRLKNQ